MYILDIKHALRRFRKSEQGTATIETVVMLPFLVGLLVFGYQHFDMFHFKSVREKATYTIADMLSRETSIVDDVYIDNTKVLFDTITGNNGRNQIRTSVVRFHDRIDPEADEIELRWSEVRGTGELQALKPEDVKTAFDFFPSMTNGQDLILVESRSVYDSSLPFGMADGTPITTNMFMTLRFASQLCFTGICAP
ncbi:MAG: pilus assembly protein [Roseovarius sp.]|nr:pilus assembly protein [Roseovarius sp.]